LEWAVSGAHRIVNPPELPEPSGYAHAVVAAPGRTVYLAGQAGSGDTVAAQFDAAAASLLTALRAAGGEPDDLVSLVVYATDVDEYRAAMSELGGVWRRRFGRRYPAMALVGVSALSDPDARVELMGVAVVADG
jgi:enamine deaminase RidA (YjgF/YER057c/UK114 family)